jgi:hypothetical protein
LTRLLTDQDADTRLWAAYALGVIGNKAVPFVDPRRLLTNRRYNTRSAAAVALLAGNSGIGPGDLCGLLEIAHDRYDQRSDRLLDAYLLATNESRPVVRWLGGRSVTELPSPDRLKHEHVVDLTRRLTVLLPHATNAPNIRKEIAYLLHSLVEKTRWSAGELDTIVWPAGEVLQKVGMTAEAIAIMATGREPPSFLQSLALWQRLILGLALLALATGVEEGIRLTIWPLGRLAHKSWLPAWWVFSQRVLDHWVAKHVAAARANLKSSPTFVRHQHYLPIPACLQGVEYPDLPLCTVRDAFRQLPRLLLICGEGGSGKTTLACDLARLALDENHPARLLPHLALPVLLENNLPAIDDPRRAFHEAVRGRLGALIGETVENEDLLNRLLRERRILVVMDRLSELAPATRSAVRPGEPDFYARALIVTSRFNEDLDGTPRTTLVTLPFQIESLRRFMAKRWPADHNEALPGSAPEDLIHLSSGVPTPLMAELYVRLLLLARRDEVSQTIHSLPDLVQAYLKQEYQEAAAGCPGGLTAILADLRRVAWECLRDHFRPDAARRDDVLRALGGKDAAGRLARLGQGPDHLVQDMGEDKVRFVLDPIAEYQAAAYVVHDMLATSPDDRNLVWQNFFAGLKVRPNFPAAIRGFLVALQDMVTAGRGIAPPPDVRQPLATAVSMVATAPPLISLPRPEESAIPADLEMLVEKEDTTEGVRLSFRLHSPNGSFPEIFERDAGSVVIPRRLDPAAYFLNLRTEIEQLVHGQDEADVTRQLTALGRRLYDDLFSNDMKTLCATWWGPARTVFIKSEEPWIPWEMLRPYGVPPGRDKDPFDDKPLCERFRVTRWLTGHLAPTPPAPPARLQPVKLRCFAVSEAAGTRGRLQEAAGVLHALAALAAQHGLRDASPPVPIKQEFLKALNDPVPALWHFFGHGDMGENPDHARIWLKDSPVTVNDVHGSDAQGARQARPVVFFNGCRTGQIADSLTRLGGWAEEWITFCHCSAFIGTHWAVTVPVAQAFADRFYEALFARQTVGEAVLTARRYVREKFPSDPSWLAYTAYAHPSARLNIPCTAHKRAPT